MYIVKNALKNLVRNKGRNILIGLIIFAMILTTAVALIINSTTVSIIDDYKSRFGSTVSITPDIRRLISEGKLGLLDYSIPRSQYDAFANSEHVKEVNYRGHMFMISDTIEQVGAAESDFPAGFMQGAANAAGPQFTVNARNSIDEMEDFPNGKRQIVEGRMFERLGECIISHEFAELNNLSVGDTFQLKSNVTAVQESINLTVSGIYYDSTDAYSGMPFKDPFQNRRNQIYTSFETLSQYAYEQEANDIFFDVSVAITIKSPDLLEAYNAELRAKGLPDYYNVTADSQSYDRVIKPVEGLKSVSLVFMVIVLALGTLILILLTSIAMRERKYEIGVMRAIGLKKWKVVAGLLSETLTMTVICLILGLSLGSLLAQPTADVVLAGQVKSINESKNSQFSGNGSSFMIVGSSNQADEMPMLDKIDVILKVDAILQIIAVSLLLAAVTTVFGARYITKYEPIKILTERS